MHIVLVNPEIPQNTGNIARTCAATGAKLHLIEPLGFELSDKYLKRAGLDYWHMMTYEVHPSRDYCDATYGPDDFLVFGRERKGLDEALLAANYDRCVRIPMVADARSLNLSNSVAVVLYEALRQQGFPGLAGSGRLHHTDLTGAWSDYV